LRFDCFESRIEISGELGQDSIGEFLGWNF